MNTNIQETTFDKTTVAKLRKRIHLPPEIYKDTHEERFVGDSKDLPAWLASYNHKSGWSIVWMESRYAVLRAQTVEVILRRHRLGNFILFRIWKDGKEQT